MARMQIPNMGSSPPSSEATHFGTPSTSITVMSPEADSSATKRETAPRFGLRVNTKAVPQTGTQKSVGSRLPLPLASSAQLSPAADVFTPRATAFPFGLRSASILSTANSDSDVSTVGALVASSMPDAHSNQQGKTHGPVGRSLSHSIANDVAGQRLEPLNPSMHVAWEQFSTDQNVTRTFQIFDKYIPSLFHIIGHFPSQFKSLACIDSRNIENGIVRLTFHDDRDAKQAYVLAASLTHTHCQLLQLTAKDLASARGKNPNVVSNFEGQLIITLVNNPAQPEMPTLLDVFNKLAAFGHIKAVHTLPSTNDSISLRVEYHDITDAETALEELNGTQIRKISILVTRYEPDVNTSTQPSTANNGRPSLTGRSTVPSSDIARLESVVARVMRESANLPQLTARCTHNHVDIERIQAGIDIMLRNIPNKVDQATLKELLDQTSFGAYDFMYLRIDFANNCNVGYAFINFVDALSIIPFARARAGQRWNIFSSDKVAEISYATIQGRDCLVQKFRNSSVMLEHPSFRPKLYATQPSPFAGQEEQFPEPDNYSKMRRSIDNAEHIGLFRHPQGTGRQASPPASICTQRKRKNQRSPKGPNATSPKSPVPISTGLFAPREGQAHREEQRRRRSQFDRGTPGAEYEASSYGLTDPALSPARAASARLFRAFNSLAF